MSPVPTCSACRIETRLTDGAEIYPGRYDLEDKPIYVCDGCRAYVGCHPGTTDALGAPAGPELRRARMVLHEKMIDPLWENAPAHYAREGRDRGQSDAVLRSIARSRVYGMLAERMGLTRAETHTAMFSLEDCRDAWRALAGVTFDDVRAWGREDKVRQEAEKAARREERAHAAEEKRREKEAAKAAKDAKCRSAGKIKGATRKTGKPSSCLPSESGPATDAKDPPPIPNAGP